MDSPRNGFSTPHPHADHFSAAGYLKDKTSAPTAIGKRVVEVQRLWKTLYNLPDTFRMDGSQWDHLFADGERFAVGELKARVLLSPGHTLCSITYVIGNAAFVQDTLFMPDSGTARCDFPGGDAQQLWRSIQRILRLPAHTRLFTGHDYRPKGRPAQWEKYRSSEGGQCAFEGLRRGQIHQASQAAGPRPVIAHTDVGGFAGEYRGWSAARSRKRRPLISEDPAQRFS